MRVFKKALAQIPLYIVFLLLGSMFVAWLFTLRMSAPQRKRIEFYADAPVPDSTALSVEMEKEMPEGITMVRGASFSQVLISSDKLLNADFYVVPASKIADYADSLLDYRGEELKDRFEAAPGGKRAIKVYDAATKKGAAKEFIIYGDEDYYLFIGVNSIHAGGDGEEAVDTAAFAVIKALLKLP